ncbi:MAG: hypothetical protein N3B21_17030 [Clostridia bacterium]|nr:hypothetical protein [Clostridia bacterium]
MSKRECLLQRLEEIGRSVERTGNALAVLGLGSVGVEVERIDKFSDLDFFLIVKKGFRNEYVDNISWITSIYPVEFVFKNTSHGYKLLYQDSVFCEFAVFEPEELSNVKFSEGRIIWRADGFDESVCTPNKQLVSRDDNPEEWLVGEAITNLYVGMCRYNRGEKLSAMRFIQVYAVDRVIELMKFTEKEISVYADVFSIERRFEQRYPQAEGMIADFVQGYHKSPESARAILKYLDENFSINGKIKELILGLCH